MNLLSIVMLISEITSSCLGVERNFLVNEKEKENFFTYLNKHLGVFFISTQTLINRPVH